MKSALHVSQSSLNQGLCVYLFYMYEDVVLMHQCVMIQYNNGSYPFKVSCYSCSFITDNKERTKPIRYKKRAVSGTVYGAMLYKDLMETIVKVWFCIPVPDFVIVLHCLKCRISNQQGKTKQIKIVIRIMCILYGS